MEVPPKKFFRLSPGTEVRLRYAYFIKCTEVIKDAAGEVIELRCTYDPATKGGNAPDGRKVKATMHWLSAAQSLPAEIRIYNPLFAKPNPDAGNFAADLNPQSLEVLSDARIEPAIAATNSSDVVQFERQGYFVRDRGFDAGSSGVHPNHRPARYLRQGSRRQDLIRLDGAFRCPAEPTTLRPTSWRDGQTVSANLTLRPRPRSIRRHAFFFGSNPTLYRGRDGVTAYFKGLPQWNSRAVRFTDVSTAQVSPDLINFAAIASFDVDGAPKLSVKITWVIAREDGDWKIVSHHVSSGGAADLAAGLLSNSRRSRRHRAAAHRRCHTDRRNRGRDSR